MNFSKIQKSFISVFKIVTVSLLLLVIIILFSCEMPTSDSDTHTQPTTTQPTTTQPTTTQPTPTQPTTSGGQQGSSSSTHTHTYSYQWTKDEYYHWHSATCEHTEQKSEYEIHNYGSSETIKEATLTQEGQVKKTCLTCGYEKTETTPKLELGYGCEWWCFEEAFLGPLDAYVYYEGDTPKRAGHTNGEVTNCLLLHVTKTQLLNGGFQGKFYKVTDLSTLPSWCLN